MHYVEGAIAGFAVGVFAPGLARKAKALWVKYAQKGESVVQAAVNNEIKKV